MRGQFISLLVAGAVHVAPDLEGGVFEETALHLAA